VLINTIILFLRDALPVFWLISLLLAQGNSAQQGYRWVFWSVPVGLILAMILMLNFSALSNLAEGAGLEWMTFVAHTLIYLLVVLHLFILRRGLNQYWPWSAALLAMLTIGVNGSYFLVFLDNYWRAGQHFWSLFTGTILGFGVCFSAGILIYLFNHAFLRRGRQGLFVLLILCWSAGQLIFTFNLLAQVNLISASAPIWNTSDWISDSSELGLVLNTLIGYEATPTLLQIITYLFCILTPLFMFYQFTSHSQAIKSTGVSE
jgi:high-affinity iron transporter